MPTASVRAGLVLAAALLHGCVSFDRQPLEQVRYALEARRDPRPRPADGPVLVVRPFHAGQGFAGKAFVYRRPDGAIETDFYAEWFVPPAIALTELAAHWLDRSGRFGAAVPLGSRVRPTHALEADLLELSADYGSTPPQARLHVRWLWLGEGERVTGSGEFDERAPLADTEAATYAQAANRLAARFLEALAATFPTAASRPAAR
jgi:cholesterol transport system auxiliary component